MKKVTSVKEITIILISLILIVMATSVNATTPQLQLGNNNDNEATQVPKNEYDNAQMMDEDKNNVTKDPVTESKNNTTNTNNSVNNKVNNTKVYNTNNSTNLPQTGIEDYNIGILLIIFTASAIFAYRKVTDYKNI